MSSASFLNSSENRPVPPTRRIIACVGMGLLGVLAFIGLRVAPTSPEAQSLAYIPPQVPESRLRLVWLDARQAGILETSLIASLQKLAPDYLLAENIDSVNLIPLAKALHMEQSLSPQLFQPTLARTGDRSAVGVCILSKDPLFDLQPLTQADAVFGLSAFSVVQGRKFMLASVCMTHGGNQDAEADELIAYWRKQERPPLVAAGAFNREMENGELVQPTTGWFDGLTPFEQIVPPQTPAKAPRPVRIMFTEGWSCLAGGSNTTPGGQIIAWVDAISAHVVATTTTAPSDLDD